MVGYVDTSTVENYHYNRDSNPKRILTKPSTPVYNDNHDNSGNSHSEINFLI